jgi:predicted RNase H-like HicB family nuclease
MSHAFRTKLTVAIYQEGKQFVAFCPALDLCTQGRSVKGAKKNFEEAFALFLEEVVKKDTLDQVLQDCGWKKRVKSWVPPKFITNVEEEVSIPV